MTLGGILQVVIAIALVILLCVVAFLVYNAEMVKTLREASKIKKTTVIFDGVKDLYISKDESYNTLDPANPTYRNIENSLNQKAGAEYTYNFWLYIDKTGVSFTESQTADNVYTTDSGLTKAQTLTPIDKKPMVLFMRGNKQAFVYKSLCGTRSIPDNEKYKVDVLVKQPLVKLENEWDVLAIELNTFNQPDGVKEKARNTCGEFNSDWEQMNTYRLALKGFTSSSSGFSGKWNMITLIVQDTFPTDPLPIRNKVRVRLYVNGVMEMDRYVDGKLADTTTKDATLIRNNTGNFYVAPKIFVTRPGSTEEVELVQKLNTADRLLMANLTYFNYAIEDEERRSLFNAGFSKKWAASRVENTAVGDQVLNADLIAIPSDERMHRELGMR